MAQSVLSSQRVLTGPGRPAAAVRWLGSSEPPFALSTHLRSRGVALVPAEAASREVPARIVMVETNGSPTVRAPRLDGRRVAVMHPDPGSADSIAQALRSKGAEVVVLSLNPASLERAEALDPDAVVMEIADFYGACWEITRAIWQHPRLKFAVLILYAPAGAEYTQDLPDFPSLCAAIQTSGAEAELLGQQARERDEFSGELEGLGAAKMLRVLLESGRAFHVQFVAAEASVQVDLAQGIVAGAEGRLRNAENDVYLGVHALSLLLQFEGGRVHIRVASRPSSTNVMTPLDAALHAARDAGEAAPFSIAAPRQDASCVRVQAPAVERVPTPRQGFQVSNAATEAPPISAQPIAVAAAPSPVEITVPLVSPRARAKTGSLPLVFDESRGITASTPPPAPRELAPRPAVKTLHGLPSPNARALHNSGRLAAVASPAPRSEVQEKEVAPARAASAQVAPRGVPEPLASQATGPSPLAAFDLPTLPASASLALAETTATAAPAGVHAGADSAEMLLPISPSTPRARASRTEFAADPDAVEGAEDLTFDGEGLSAKPRRLRTWAAVAGGAALLACVALLLGTSSAPEKPAAVSRPAEHTQATAQPAPLAAKPASAPVVAVAPAQVNDRSPTAAEPAVAAAPALPDEADEAAAADEIDEVDAARRASVERASRLVSQGQALRARKQYGPAKARYQEALRAFPGYPRAVAGLVAIALAQSDGKQAVKLAKQLVRARPGQTAYQVLLGDAYQSAGMLKDAQSAWKAAARRGSAAARARLKTVR